jgi:uncharacterized membrane protein
MPAWRIAAAAAALVAYALLSNWLMVHAANQPWAVAALFGPLLLAVAGAGWQRRQWPTLAGCGVLVVVLAVIVARGGVGDMQRMYLLQHGALHLALAWSFAITLRAGATPFITALAEGLHTRLRQSFTPAMHAYTRQLTAVWVGYFLGMVLVSGLIYALAPWEAWSFFCNLVTPAAAILLFVGEHVLRYRRHPEFARVSLRAAFEAYQHSGRGGGVGS